MNSKQAEPLHAVTPYGPTAGSSRVRVFDWMERLADPVEVHPYAGLGTSSPKVLGRNLRRVLHAERDLKLLAGKRLDRLLLHREASPLSRGSREVRLLANAHFSAYDLDDALYLDTGEGPRYRSLAPKATKARLAAIHSSRVIAGNETLAEWASQHNEDVVVIPSCVDPSAYETKVSYELHDPPSIGWVGSWSTEKHLRSITGSLQRLHERTGARITLIGAPVASGPGRLGALETIVDRIPWSLHAQREYISHFDVAVMPLVDDPYARGKCGYKLLQYLAVGVPSVASPVGVNRTILQQAGLPAAISEDDWYQALIDLLGASADRRTDMGAQARRTVADHYSFDAWRSVWRRATGLDQ